MTWFGGGHGLASDLPHFRPPIIVFDNESNSTWRI